MHCLSEILKFALVNPVARRFATGRLLRTTPFRNNLPNVTCQMCHRDILKLKKKSTFNHVTNNLSESRVDLLRESPTSSKTGSHAYIT